MLCWSAMKLMLTVATYRPGALLFPTFNGDFNSVYVSYVLALSAANNAYWPWPHLCQYAFCNLFNAPIVCRCVGC
jgi:hypothetical protein